jgi:hypothetical protein
MYYNKTFMSAIVVLHNDAEDETICQATNVEDDVQTLFMRGILILPGSNFPSKLDHLPSTSTASLNNDWTLASETCTRR